MGSAVEIKDIKIINQCLGVKGGVMASLPLPLSLSPSLSPSFSSVLTLCWDSQSLEVDAVKVVFSASCSTGTLALNFSGCKSGSNVHVYSCVMCLSFCGPPAAISCQTTAWFWRCDLLMDRLWGVTCIMQKHSVVTHLQTDNYSSLFASHLSFCLFLFLYSEYFLKKSLSQRWR